MKKEYINIIMPEISGQRGNYSASLKDFPVKQVKGRNEYAYLRDEFALDMVTQMEFRYSYKTKGLFKKRYLCPKCKVEIDLSKTSDGEVQDKVTVDDIELQYKFKGKFLDCICGQKIFSKEMEDCIWEILIDAMDNKNILPYGRKGYYT